MLAPGLAALDEVAVLEMTPAGCIEVQVPWVGHLGDANLTQAGDNYLALLKPLQFGKRLPRALYMHESCLGSLPRQVVAAVETAREIASIDVGAFNVVKLALTQTKVSLLH